MFGKFVNYINVILLTYFLLSFAKIEIVDIKPAINKNIEKQILFDNYSWMTQEVYNAIVKNSDKFGVKPFLIAAIIEKESRIPGLQNLDRDDQVYNRQIAMGPEVTVKLQNNKGYYFTKTRAIGMMQVMGFHYEGDDSHDLFNIHTNIKTGTKVFYDCKVKFSKRINQLRCYNAGPRSSHYNWPYIKEIIRNEKKLSLLYKSQRI